MDYINDFKQGSMTCVKYTHIWLLFLIGTFIKILIINIIKNYTFIISVVEMCVYYNSFMFLIM